MTSACVIETSELTKAYGAVQAVRELNLAVKRGYITAFLARNGAGKSTTIKMLLGMIAPSSGEGMVLGQRIRHAEENLLRWRMERRSWWGSWEAT
jgi:ABC-2 type transport system ATP-binding protein